MLKSTYYSAIHGRVWLHEIRANCLFWVYGKLGYVSDIAANKHSGNNMDVYGIVEV